MSIGYVIMVGAGIIGANGIPHFVKGITGSRHMTPFGKPSSATINVAWGAANFVAALWLGLRAARYDLRVGIAGTLAIIGGMLAGLGLARVWQNDPVARGEQALQA